MDQRSPHSPHFKMRGSGYLFTGVEDSFSLGAAAALLDRTRYPHPASECGASFQDDRLGSWRGKVAASRKDLARAAAVAPGRFGKTPYIASHHPADGGVAGVAEVQAVGLGHGIFEE